MFTKVLFFFELFARGEGTDDSIEAIAKFLYWIPLGIAAGVGQGIFEYNDIMSIAFSFFLIAPLLLLGGFCAYRKRLVYLLYWPIISVVFVAVLSALMFVGIDKLNDELGFGALFGLLNGLFILSIIQWFPWNRSFSWGTRDKEAKDGL